MRYCLSSRLGPRYLAQCDEIKIKYKDRRGLPDLAHKYSKATMILMPPETGEIDWDEIERIYHAANQRMLLNVSSVNDAKIAKSKNISFMLNTEVCSYYDLRGVIALGAKSAYIGAPLFFDLLPIQQYDIELRVIPTQVYNSQLPHKGEEYAGTWLRPEDVDTYEGFIDTLEFEDDCPIEREETLFKIYHDTKEWKTRMDLLFPQINSEALNRLIDPHLVYRRLECRQKCMRDGRCHACLTALKLASIIDELPPVNTLIDKKE